MTSIADSSVIIQTSSESVPSTPCWLGEVVLIVHHLRKLGVLDAITSQVRFARRRFGHYEVIDFLAVLAGLRHEWRTHPGGVLRAACSPLRNRSWPASGARACPRARRSRAISRALTPEPVEALRSLFLADLLARPLGNEREIGGLVDRTGKERVIFDIDGTREAVRQRALPQTSDRPTAQRRMTQVCAPGYTGRKRTAVSQAHSYQWLGSFGNQGLGQYREELRLAVGAIQRYLSAHQLPQERARLAARWAIWHWSCPPRPGWLLVRGTLAVTMPCWIDPRSRRGGPLPADQSFTRPESALERILYDCPDVPVGPNGARCRVVVATHPANAQKRRVGHTRQGIVYELFFTNLPQEAFMASDIVALYLHRGADLPVLADEDQELDPDRWCSHSPAGQQAWQIVSQWIWNVRLELGHQLEPTELRTTEFAPAVSEAKEQQPASRGYGKPSVAAPWKAGRFSGQDFVLQSDGTVRCPANQSLVADARRREADGSLRVVYAASIRSCRPCPLREQCQWQGSATTKPRQVSVLLHPLVVGSAPLLVA
jgi:hypothetical protein